MFEPSAAFYDAIYAFKDYAAEARLLHTFISARMPAARTLLDAACGTGAHLAHLREHYTVSGFDLQPELLAIARERLPDAPLMQADMLTVDLGQTYDVVTCLFSSIGYVTTLDNLHTAVRALRRHVAPGGLLIIEPWFTVEQFHDRHLNLVTVDQPDLKLARMTLTEVWREDPVPRSILHFQYLVGTREGLSTFSEDHVLGLFSDAQYRAACADAGLTGIEFIDGGLDGRGLYVGRG